MKHIWDKFSGRGLSLWLVALWLLAVSLGAAAETEAADSLDRVRARIEQAFGHIQQRLHSLAEDPQLRESFAARDEDALQTRAGTEILPHLQRLTFVLQDSPAQDALGFSSLQQMERMDRGEIETYGPEMREPGTEQAHIMMLQAVRAEDGTFLGAIHLALSVDLLDEAFPHIKDSSRIVLQQTSRYGDIDLVSTEDEHADQGISREIRIGESSWVLREWSDEDAADLSDEPAEETQWRLYGALAFMLFIFLCRRRIIASLRGARKSWIAEGEPVSQVQFEGAVRHIMEGGLSSMRQFVPHLPEGAPGVETRKADSDSWYEEPTTQSGEAIKVDAEIFRAYDIRGVVSENFDAVTARNIARAIGGWAEELQQDTIVVGRDGRLTSPDLSAAVIAGLHESGRNVIDIGMAPSPLLYFATEHLRTGSGVMLTGSHNDPEYNGMKIMLRGETLYGDAIQELMRRTKQQIHNKGQGALEQRDVSPDYVARLQEDINDARKGFVPTSSLHCVVDAGNGVMGPLAVRALSALGHHVTPLHCEVDGKFPNHLPDPSQPKNMAALVKKVREEKAEIGFAFDGDGDRLGVVDSAGQIIWPDRYLMLLAQDVLAEHPGATVLYDVKCTRHLRSLIESHGGKPMMCRTGHSLVKAKMREQKAVLAGEFSGHIFIKGRWNGFDDALYAAARMMEILLQTETHSAELFATLPDAIGTPELRMPLPSAEHAGFMHAAEQGMMRFGQAKVITIDGIRVEAEDSWGLVRASNTSPYIIFRFEADSKEALAKMQKHFRRILLEVKPDLEIPWA